MTRLYTSRFSSEDAALEKLEELSALYTVTEHTIQTVDPDRSDSVVLNVVFETLDDPLAD